MGHPQISKEKFIEALVSNADNKTNEDQAAILGIGTSYFYRLKKQYAPDIVKVAIQYAQQYSLSMVQQLVKNAHKGSDKAALAVLAIGGAYEPAKSGNVDQSKTINVTVIEKFIKADSPDAEGKEVIIPAEVVNVEGAESKGQ